LHSWQEFDRSKRYRIEMANVNVGFLNDAFPSVLGTTKSTFQMRSKLHPAGKRLIVRLKRSPIMTAVQIRPRFTPASGYTAGDLNGDGKPDLGRV
jgi:hypothetical protein